MECSSVKILSKIQVFILQENALEEIVCSVSTNIDHSRHAGNMPELYQYWPDAPKRTPFSQHKYIITSI